MHAKNIGYRKEDHIVKLTLNRPRQSKPFSSGMINDFVGFSSPLECAFKIHDLSHTMPNIQQFLKTPPKERAWKSFLRKGGA